MGKQRKKLMIITAFIMSIMFTMAGWGFSMELSFLNEGHVLNLLEQSGFYESASGRHYGSDCRTDRTGGTSDTGS